MFLQNSSPDELWHKPVNLLFPWMAGKQCSEPSSTLGYHSPANPEQHNDRQSNSFRTADENRIWPEVSPRHGLAQGPKNTNQRKQEMMYLEIRSLKVDSIPPNLLEHCCNTLMCAAARTSSVSKVWASGILPMPLGTVSRAARSVPSQQGQAHSCLSKVTMSVPTLAIPNKLLTPARIFLNHYLR